jgi:hypothetical protein
VDPKQLLLAHFEKILLGAFGIWLAAVGVFFVSEPAELRQNKALAGKMGAIGRHFSSASVDDLDKPDWSTRLKSNLSPDTVESAAPFPPWAMNHRPVFLYGVEAIAQGHAARHEPPVDLTVDSGDRGQVTLKWQASVQNEYVIIAHYIIERRIGEDGKWKQIAEIDGVEETYGDTKVRSRTEYHYRVTSIAEIDRDNPVVDTENMQLAKADERKVGDEAGPIKTAQDVYMIPTNGDPVTNDEAIKGQDEKNEWAYIRVYKWIGGKFVNKSYRVKRGGKIGKLEKKRGKKLDFSTGATLVDVLYKEVAGRQEGHTRQVLAIQFKFSDGSTGMATEKDEIPSEVKGN